MQEQFLDSGAGAQRDAEQGDPLFSEAAARHEVDRGRDVQTLELAERETIAVAIAVAAKIEQQNAETLGDEEVGDVFESTVIFRAIRVPAVDHDGGAVPANGEEPAPQGEAVARPEGYVLIRRGGHVRNGEVADHGGE